MRKHVANGITAWAVRIEDVEPRFLEDIATFDFEFVSIWETPRGSDTIQFARWSTNADYVTRARAIQSHLSYRAERICTAAELDAWLTRVRGGEGHDHEREAAVRHPRFGTRGLEDAGSFE
jgi:hypothetical protein